MRRPSTLLLLALFCVVMAGAAGCTDSNETAGPQTGVTGNPDGTWTRVIPVGAVPTPRHDFGMSYDPVDNKVIMFGGYSDATDQDGRRRVQLNDTWAYDPQTNTWTELRPAGRVPAARCGCSMVYDTARKRMVLFGGYDETAEPMWLSDTWAFDPATAMWTDLGSDHPEEGGPFGCFGFSIVYVADVDKIVLFGGLGLYPGNAVWTYDAAANAWRSCPTPAPVGDLPECRSGASLDYDAASKKVILLGGLDDSTVGDGPYRPHYFADTWAYDPVADAWAKLDTAGDPPHVRNGRFYDTVLPMVLDDARNRVVMFGGWHGNGAEPRHPERSYTWAYDLATSTWTPLLTSGDLPDRTWGEFMVYDSADDLVLLFGADWSLYTYVAAAPSQPRP